jgi:hypothetical protein
MFQYYRELFGVAGSPKKIAANERWLQTFGVPLYTKPLDTVTSITLQQLVVWSEQRREGSVGRTFSRVTRVHIFMEIASNLDAGDR